MLHAGPFYQVMVERHVVTLPWRDSLHVSTATSTRKGHPDRSIPHLLNLVYGAKPHLDCFLHDPDGHLV